MKPLDVRDKWWERTRWWRRLSDKQINALLLLRMVRNITPTETPFLDAIAAIRKAKT
jgi:hypothetical protein